MTRIAAVTVARSDYGILLPVARAIAAAPGLELSVIVAGTHLSPAFGLTVRGIESDGFTPAARVEMTLATDTGVGIASSVGLGIAGFAGAFDRLQPEMVLLIGDRFETLAAAVAAVPLTLPIGHIHGGEVTEGAFDDQIRHAITKLSHLHFVATRKAGERVRQMGEEPWRVHVTGAPGLDLLRQISPLPLAEVERRVGIPLGSGPLLVTFHPVTLEAAETDTQVAAVAEALAQLPHAVVITAPNADVKYGGIREVWTRLAASSQGRIVVCESLGPELYTSLLHHACAMVGNSSSGLIEAPSTRLPVVNIGNRQAGRERGENVVDVPPDTQAIVAAVTAVTDAAFRRRLAEMKNPYGDGNAAGRIVERLQQLPDRRHLLTKKFTGV